MVCGLVRGQASGASGGRHGERHGILAEDRDQLRVEHDVVAGAYSGAARIGVQVANARNASGIESGRRLFVSDLLGELEICLSPSRIEGVSAPSVYAIAASAFGKVAAPASATAAAFGSV
ncbi:MAG: hypothetical protein B7Z66_15310 [Chromatiales bacterium 21-64-14]|nr:MAG: hypothetical protein B7Z66_15310 [Chromatiales bacterium 21-64-14]